MNLVQYSDSEGSDTEAPPAPKQAPKPATSSAKPAFQKVVDRSNPHKIRVNLPSTATSSAVTDGGDADAPPAKKARTGGGAFSGFNSFLPAPKRTGEAAAKKGLGAGLGKDVSLKTGAAPGFSREPVEPVESGEGDKQKVGENEEAGQADALKEEPKEEVKLVGNTTRFMPLSVANKAKKKKKTSAAVLMANKATAEFPATSSAPALASTPESKAMPTPPPSNPKVSLFSISTEDSAPITSSSSGEYQPMLYSFQQTDTTSVGDNGEGEATKYQSQSTAQPAGPQSLDSIAADLNLSEAERRQLFGRQRGNGPSDLSAINVVNFNTDQEYAANEALRASGETVQHNPLRAIAPGKHSLKQLVNAAATQKDALEEHFAAGKRNKKEAGTKYGW